MPSSLFTVLPFPSTEPKAPVEQLTRLLVVVTNMLCVYSIGIGYIMYTLCSECNDIARSLLLYMGIYVMYLSRLTYR